MHNHRNLTEISRLTSHDITDAEDFVLVQTICGGIHLPLLLVDVGGGNRGSMGSSEGEVGITLVVACVTLPVERKEREMD